MTVAMVFARIFLLQFAGPMEILTGTIVISILTIRVMAPISPKLTKVNVCHFSKVRILSLDG